MSNEIIVPESKEIAEQKRAALSVITGFQLLCWPFARKWPFVGVLIKTLDQIKRFAKGEITEEECRANCEELRKGL